MSILKKLLSIVEKDEALSNVSPDEVNEVHGTKFLEAIKKEIDKKSTRHLN